MQRPHLEATHRGHDPFSLFFHMLRSYSSPQEWDLPLSLSSLLLVSLFLLFQSGIGQVLAYIGEQCRLGLCPVSFTSALLLSTLPAFSEAFC